MMRNRLRAVCRTAVLLGSVFAAPAMQAQSGTRWIVGIDRSASRTPQQMKDARQFVTTLVPTLTYGDEFTIMETFRANTDSVRQWRGAIPSLAVPGSPRPKERRTLETFVSAARLVTRPYTDTTGQRLIQSTDIIGSIWRAADYARSGASKRTVLILLSDMLNSTPSLEMERRSGVPAQSWIDRQRAQGLLPDLSGVCVVAVGGEAGTPRGVAVQRFWTAYFMASGAKLDARNYRTYMQPGDISC